MVKVVRIEEQIIRQLVAHLGLDGWRLDNHTADGEEEPCTTVDGILQTLEDCPDVWFYFKKGDAKHGVRLIDGNSEDVISDWGYASDDADGFNACMDKFITALQD